MTDSLTAFQQEQHQRRNSAFGDLVATQSANVDASRSLQDTADELIARASLALRAGDEQRARRTARHALALPFDEHEESMPAWWAASRAVHNVVCDALEMADDDSWLQAAERLVPSLTGRPEDEFRSVLSVVRTTYDLTREEHRRCRAMTNGASSTESLEAPEVEDGQAVDLLLSILTAVNVYEDTFDAVLTQG